MLLSTAMLSCAHADSVPAATAVAKDPGTIRVLLVALRETTLSSQMNGMLGDIRVTLGQRVAKDAVLAQMDCRELNARVDIAEAELKTARQALDAKRNLQKLDAAGDIEVAMATAEVEKAQGALTLATTQSSYCRIAAPFAARIARINVKPYQAVAAGTPLFDLVSDGPLKVRLNAPSTFLGKLQPGAALDISIHETGRSYPAKISAVSARIDAVAQTVELEARLDGEHPELIAGMSGIARLK
ncbi:MAG TPA: efflux RND transporter periplasmic adaptor subunit [Povalibacter sp.]|uniref:efflux RND transporter periplasmic adaptor subunit n=1 Tax=Povalibacter sp. TaxID=1962978 RepID=UPI002CECC52D|nr:efflux RND transporter periplasmic adaptor subunit [Povalibacter sp.]HMN43339.1 efflux RND transporter periplasmic adaptor subunit [Povalibacter sp.]